MEAQGTPAIIAPQYDYASLTAQQPPLLEISLQMSRANAHTAVYPDYYTVSPPPRSQISHDYSVQQLTHSPLPAGHNARPVELRYSAPSERRLSSGSGPSHDSQPGQARTSAILVYGDQKPPMSSSSEHQEHAMDTATPNDPRKSQKKTSTAVIACRQWCVSRLSLSYFIKSLIKKKTTNCSRAPGCLCCFLFLPPSFRTRFIAVDEKYVAIPQDLYVIIASDVPTYASTI